MKNIFTSLFLLILFLVSSTSFGAFAETEKVLRGNLHRGLYSSDEPYKVGPGDVLSYKEFTHPDDYSQTDVLVRSDGKATFAGVGELDIAGKTVQEITDLLTERISEFVKRPMITVNISRTRPGLVYLSGAVMKPGMFEMTTFQGSAYSMPSQGMRFNLKLSNVLANGGGVRIESDLSRVKITRGSSGRVEEVDLWKVLKGEDASQDVWIQSGDTIDVPFNEAYPQVALNYDDYILLLRSPIGPGTVPVRVMGWVVQPGVYQIDGTSPYLNSAVSKAGGYQMGANKHEVVIRRFKDETHFETFSVRADGKDVILQPNDVIYVSELKLYKAGRMVEQVNKIISPITSVTAAILFPVLFIMRR